MIKASHNKGVFFIANDAVFDLTVPFLNSFRTHNPSLHLCLIPFDDNSTRVKALATKYRFQVFDDSRLLAVCDDISIAIHGEIRGHYRKLACFEGPFESFSYIDCDTVINQNIDFCFPILSDLDFLFSHSDESSLVKWVWKDSIYESGLLSGRQIAFAANTGFFVSSRHALRVADVAAIRPQISTFVPHMTLACVEQPLLNLLVVTSGKRYGSLLSLVKSGARPGLPLEKWAGGGLLSRVKDSVDHVSDNFFLYHWAGSWAPTKFDAYVDAVLRFFFPRHRSATVRRFLHNGRIWRRYRNMDYKGEVASDYSPFPSG